MEHLMLSFTHCNLWHTLPGTIDGLFGCSFTLVRVDCLSVVTMKLQHFQQPFVPLH